MEGKVCTKCGQFAPMPDYVFPSTRVASACRACRNKAKVEYRREKGAVSRTDRSMRAFAKRVALRQISNMLNAIRTLRGDVKRAHTLEYYTWQSMKQRCTRPAHPKYSRYGGRGIRVCDKWMRSFDAFLSDVGCKPSPELSLDRINNDGHYEPGNVRWATSEQQHANQTYRGGKYVRLGSSQ